MTEQEARLWHLSLRLWMWRWQNEEHRERFYKQAEKVSVKSEYRLVFEHDPPIRLRYPGRDNDGYVWYGRVIGSKRREAVAVDRHPSRDDPEVPDVE